MTVSSSGSPPGRIQVAEVLREAGYDQEWISSHAAVVSQIYARRRRDETPHGYPVKQGGVAVYLEFDRAGLLATAMEIRDGTSRRPEDRSTAPTCPVCTRQHPGEC